MDEPRTVRRWGYSATDSRIFELPIGEDLPEGYYDSPAKVSQNEPEPDTERETLLAEARELGIDTRGRQTNETLRRKIGEARIRQAVDEAEEVVDEPEPEPEPVSA